MIESRWVSVLATRREKSCSTSRFSVRSRPMDSLLKLLRDDAALTPAQLAAMLNLPEPEVRARIEDYEKNHIILGYRAILNEERLGVETVRALIEVRITPERG